MTTQCSVCSKTFQVTQWEKNFLKQWDIPDPKQCEDCRRQQRLAQRPKNFYMRKCDLCGEQMMSFFSPKITDFKVYCNTCWQSDKWDGFEYGRDFDFTRPFFEQFYELYKIAPKHASNSIENENSQYIISAHRNKNCYLGDEYDYCEDSYYGFSYQNCRNIVDSAYVTKSELGYELIKCDNCYQCAYLYNSYNCVDSYFLLNCRGVKNSILCSGLRNVEYHVLNKPVSKEVFEAEKKKILSGSYTVLQSYLTKYEELKKKTIYPHLIGTDTHASNGNYLTKCEAVHNSYFSNGCVNCRNVQEMQGAKDCMDIDWYQAELGYQCCHVGPDSNNVLGDLYVWYSNFVWYSNEVHYSQDVFGSCSLKKQKYVIFNKQYSQAEYFNLRDRIVAHMKQTGEWGQFFPATFSPHGYDQTFAQRLYPLTKVQVLDRGWKWMDDDITLPMSNALTELSDSIDDVDESICKQTLLCQACSKPYRIVPQELAFYKQFKLPLPRLCFESRNQQRFNQLGPRTLWQRDCMCTQIDHGHSGKCINAFETTFAPDRSEVIYCERCYLQSVN